MKNLSERALLVNLTISQWGARKYDKSVSREIEKEHNAHNAGRYNKILIAENELSEIQKIASGARSFLYDNTLPWGDNGDRLLPSTNYFEFVNQFRAFKSSFEVAASNFISQYPVLKEDARRRLNGMFRETDYPAAAVIRSKFNIEITFLPIPDSTDFRLQINEEEVSHLRTQIETEINSRITHATKNIWTRIKDAVGHMVEKLSVKDAVFRDTLVTNIQELVDILPRLNFTNDKDITAVIDSMKTLLIHPDALRKNATIRNQKAEEAKAILDKINDFFD
ncbi:hypothetical protein [Chitinophaga cymbidii]|uniref:Uncharacterized protein n=1 Tax=Chitinophaga cymbidii TaxID=1096750 RepID=A0A512RPT0_9BACT|nr:hypothetical protein [Chitinophaga cymbidii]GEP97684.1 hypothetical protein CCY01nite_39440 [Chitinophaga cymbidii]